jgi:3-dehydroquinate synthase
MVSEAAVAVRVGLLRRREHDRLRELLSACRLPTRIPRGLDAKVFLGALGFDKKRSNDRILLPLPTRAGRMRPAVEVTFEQLLE